MVTRALSLKAFGTPQNLLQSPARDQFCTVLPGGGCLSQQDRMGLPVPVSSMAWLLRGAAAALPGLGHWMLVLERAGARLVSVSPPESLRDTAECRGEPCCPGTARRLPPASCAGLWQASVRTQ